jgi:hypothetical protein
VQYAGKDWSYNYRRLFDLCSEDDLKSRHGQISQQYAKLTKCWTVESNSEWSCRTYFATKMILNATVLFNSLDFAERMGLRTANPYFEYYATLSLLRGLVYTLPSELWQSGKLIEISHTKAINLAFDWLAKFNKTKADELKETTLQLKAQRELIAYRAPASARQKSREKL